MLGMSPDFSCVLFMDFDYQILFMNFNFCNYVYRFTNDTFESRINHTNDLYGGFNPGVSNVYFTHGSFDPWHRMGVLSDVNKHSPAAVIPGIVYHFIFLDFNLIFTPNIFVGISHCSDLGSINYKSNSKELINSKVQILNLVKKWLKY